MFYKKIFKVPLYPFYFTVVVTDEIEKFKELEIHPKDTEDMDEPRDLYATTFKFANEFYPPKNKKVGCPLILLNFRNELTPLSKGVVIHELIHLKNIMFDSLGLKLKTSNDEAEAYLMMFLSDVVLNYLDEVIEEENSLLNQLDKEVNKISYTKSIE